MGSGDNSAEKRLTDLLNNESIRGLLSVSSFISFLLGNLIIFYLISLFFDFTSLFGSNPVYTKGLYFLLGTLLSLLLIKTSYFIKPLKKESNGKDNEIGKTKETNEKLDIGGWNAFLIFVNSLFLNLFGYLFIVLLIWSAIFWIIYSLNWSTLIENSFNNLLGVLSVIGILSGIFQFYLPLREEDFSKKVISILVKNEETKKERDKVRKLILSNLMFSDRLVTDLAEYDLIDENKAITDLAVYRAISQKERSRNMKERMVSLIERSLGVEGDTPTKTKKDQNKNVP